MSVELQLLRGAFKAVKFGVTMRDQIRTAIDEADSSEYLRKCARCDYLAPHRVVKVHSEAYVCVCSYCDFVQPLGMTSWLTVDRNGPTPSEIWITTARRCQGSSQPIPVQHGTDALALDLEEAARQLPLTVSGLFEAGEALASFTCIAYDYLSILCGYRPAAEAIEFALMTRDGEHLEAVDKRWTTWQEPGMAKWFSTSILGFAKKSPSGLPLSKVGKLTAAVLHYSTEEEVRRAVEYASTRDAGFLMLLLQVVFWAQRAIEARSRSQA